MNLNPAYHAFGGHVEGDEGGELDYNVAGAEDTYSVSLTHSGMIGNIPTTTVLRSYTASEMVLIGWSIIFSAILMLPVSVFYLPEVMPSIQAITSAIWLGAVSTGIGFIGYVRLIDKIGAVRTSTVAYFLPVFGIIWGAIFLGEIITSTIVIGCFVVLLGIYLSNSNKKGYVNSVNTKAQI